MLLEARRPGARSTEELPLPADLDYKPTAGRLDFLPSHLQGGNSFIPRLESSLGHEPCWHVGAQRLFPHDGGSWCAYHLGPHNPDAPSRRGLGGEEGRQAASSRNNSLFREANVRALRDEHTEIKNQEQGPPPPQEECAITLRAAGQQKRRKCPPLRCAQHFSGQMCYPA